MPHPRESNSATKNSNNLMDVPGYLCPVGLHAVGWRSWEPSACLHRWLLQKVEQVTEVTLVQKKPSAFSGRVLPHSLRLKSAHF